MAIKEDLLPKLEVKKDINKSITHAKSSINNFFREDIECNNINQLTYILNNINEAGGMIILFTRLFPKDKDAEKLHREITELHDLGYKAKEKFLSQCQCKDKR